MAQIQYQVVNRFGGYEHKKDITNSDPGILIRGTQNVLINDYEKVISRRGTVLKGAAKTVNIGINSSYDEFVTVKGIKVPLRGWPSGTAARDVIQVWYQNAWRTITANTNPIPVGTHESNFTEQWDTATQQSRLIWVNGTTQVMMWSGGIGTIAGLTANTLSLAPGLTWTGEGFNDSVPFGIGTDKVIINGVAYTYTGGVGTQTLTGVTPNPVGSVNIGDIAFDDVFVSPLKVNGVDVDIAWDICSSLYNQVYYGNYLTRGVYVSYGIQTEESSGTLPTNFVGTGINDGVFSSFAPGFTGNENELFKVEIDGVSSTSFLGTGINDASFSGTSSAATHSQYKVMIDGIEVDYSTLVGSFQVGEAVNGIFSSAAGIVTFDDGVSVMNIQVTSGRFQPGEQILGSISGATATIDDYTDTFSWFGNGVILGSLIPCDAITPTLLANGISVLFGFEIGHNMYDQWVFEVDPGAGDQDTFQYFVNGNFIASQQPITAGAISLIDNVDITFGQVKGHNRNDYWTSFLIHQVFASWIECGFGNPRLPGQGALLLLDSPPIGMHNQEENMYINSRAGSWFINTFNLAADLQSESLAVNKLKSQPQTQILHHNLLSSILNSLVFVSNDKTYDTLGRLNLIQTPQSLPISDRVRDDFLEADFTNGTIRFFENKSYITAPNDIRTFVFDHILDLWQPPQTFPIGRLAVIDDRICGHSYTTNETYVLFEGLSDNGQPIESIALFSYENYGTRANLKSFNEFYIEGYIRANTTLDTLIRYEIDGCGTEIHDSIDGSDTQIVCIGGDDRSLGKKSLGVFSLAALRTQDDPDGPFPKFRVIKTMPRYNFFEQAFGVSSYGTDLKWAILAFGPGAAAADQRNNYIKQ